MAAYRIKALGSGFAVGTEDGAVLICRTMKGARRVIADAERLERMPPRSLWPGVSCARDADVTAPAGAAEPDHSELTWRSA